MRLVWSRAALYDLEELAAYIAEDSWQAAALVETRIHEQTRLILRFPRIGHPGRHRGTRERFVPGTRYILVYRLLQEKIRILRVYHAARRWPSRFE